MLCSLDVSAQSDLIIRKVGSTASSSSDRRITEEKYFDKDGKTYRIKISIDTLASQPAFAQICARFLFKDSVSSSLQEAIKSYFKQYTPCSATSNISFTHYFAVIVQGGNAGVYSSVLLKRTVTTHKGSEDAEKAWRWNLLFDERHGKLLTIDDILIPEEAEKIKGWAGKKRLHLSVKFHGLELGVLQQGKLETKRIVFSDKPDVFLDSFRQLIGEDDFSEETRVFDVVEQMPSFPGGRTALMEYLNQNIKYPLVAEKLGINGRVITQFVVDRDGSITNVKVISSTFSKAAGWGGVKRDLEPLDDRVGEQALRDEALRVVSTMPRWMSGKQNGTAVRVKYTLPITFRL